MIYGFSSKAPVGATAASTLDRYFQVGANGEIGGGRVSPRMLGRFAANSMVATSGLSESEPKAAHRADVCQFSDDRLSPAQKLAFVHQLLNRETAEVACSSASEIPHR